jgi:hypothetical protein
MKYIIKESKINQFISTYLDGQDWYFWDIGDDEFNISEGEGGMDQFKYRVQYSSTVPDHSFEVLYLNENLVERVKKIFSVPKRNSIKSIIDWFNNKYNKNLTVENLELFFDEDDYQDYEND